MKGRSVVGLVLLLSTDSQLVSTMGQAGQLAAVLRPAVQQIQSQTRIPILLPAKLPSIISQGGVKLADGRILHDGYFIALYSSEMGADASFVAGFGGSTVIVQDMPGTQRVALSGGRTGMFKPVLCGGSCAPANLWWVQEGVMYQIQIRLRSDSTEKEQEKALVETANSMVIARRE